MNNYNIRKNNFIPKKRSNFFSQLSITKWLIVINIIVFIVAFFLELIYGEKILDYLALYPAHIIIGQYLWTLVTHMFMHAGLLHLAVNMFVLYSLGGLSEKIIGRKRFIWFYLISGILAGLLSAYLAGFYGSGFGAKIFGTPNIYMVGASGAIFGIAGLFVTLLPKIRFSIIFLPFFSLPGYIMVPVVLIITWLASIAANLPFGNVAHFGGFIVGLVYGYYLKTKYRKKVLILEKFFK